MGIHQHRKNNWMPAIDGRCSGVDKTPIRSLILFHRIGLDRIGLNIASDWILPFFLNPIQSNTNAMQYKPNHVLHNYVRTNSTIFQIIKKRWQTSKNKQLTPIEPNKNKSHTNNKQKKKKTILEWWRQWQWQFLAAITTGNRNSLFFKINSYWVCITIRIHGNG